MNHHTAHLAWIFVRMSRVRCGPLLDLEYRWVLRVIWERLSKEMTFGVGGIWGFGLNGVSVPTIGSCWNADWMKAAELAIGALDTRRLGTWYEWMKQTKPKIKKKRIKTRCNWILLSILNLCDCHRMACCIVWSRIMMDVILDATDWPWWCWWIIGLLNEFFMLFIPEVNHHAWQFVSTWKTERARQELG